MSTYQHKSQPDQDIPEPEFEEMKVMDYHSIPILLKPFSRPRKPQNFEIY